MRKLSVKVKITGWYLLLMTIMAGLLLAFLVAVSGSVSTQTAMDQLEQTVRANLRQVDMADGSLQFGENFLFYDNGVYTLIYSQSEALLAGQVPVGFTASEPFQNGLTRPVDVDGARYYVLDFWVPLGWDSGVWVRGVLEAPENPRLVTNLLYIAMIALPLFILLAAAGGYAIARRAFRPLDRITATAAAIGEAADLSRRVEVPPGDNEFTRLARTFNQMFERLERSFEAEQQFTADASHELRTPVSVIKSACEYAEKYGETPEEREETMAMIHRQADRMSLLIEQLLRITRLDQGTGISLQENVDLTELVRTACADQPREEGRLLVEAEAGISVRGTPPSSPGCSRTSSTTASNTASPEATCGYPSAGRRGRSSCPSGTTASASRRTSRRRSGSGSTRWTPPAAAAAARDWAWPWYGRSPRPTADAWSWRASPAWAASLPSASPPTRFDRGQHVQAAGYPRRLDIYSQERQDRDIPKKHLKNLSSFHVDFM